MQLIKSFFTISLVTIFIVSCSSVQVTEESVRESSIATVEVSTTDTYETKSTAVSTSATIYFDFDQNQNKLLQKLIQLLILFHRCQLLILPQSQYLILLQTPRLPEQSYMKQ